MMLFIVRFQPLGGGNCTDAHFRDVGRANALYEKAKLPPAGPWFEFKDDFGIQAMINLTQHNVILTDTHKSAAGMKAMTEANHDAFRTYGLVPQGGAIGSTH